MNGNEQRSTTTWVIGILVVILALLVVWFMFRGTGPEEASNALEREGEQAADEVREGAETAADETARATARAEARAELLALEARLEVEENYEEVADEVADIRADLRAAYEDASAEARAEYETEIQPAFANFEAALRAGTADVLDFFASLLVTLEADVRTDEE